MIEYILREWARSGNPDAVKWIMVFVGIIAVIYLVSMPVLVFARLAQELRKGDPD